VSSALPKAFAIAAATAEAGISSNCEAKSSEIPSNIVAAARDAKEATTNRHMLESPARANVFPASVNA
jgi:hypothetical protein